ncbi:Glutaredoxin arsenate reductase [bacterium HR11]|nr:Glutaredoxin arsenate reductase [bacterium HR11]
MTRRVLFLCTENSARSQMAEGLLRHLGGPAFEVYSAGTRPSAVHLLTVRVMQEVGIDIRDQYAKSVEAFRDMAFDVVVTLCDGARETCPVLPGAPLQLHWDIPDPRAVEGSEDERLAAFRRARDLIRARIRETFGV